MSTRQTHIVALGDHDVWEPPLTGSLLRSERIAVGLAKHYRVTYVCTGDPSADEDLRRHWAENAGIAGVVLGTSNKLKTTARWAAHSMHCGHCGQRLCRWMCGSSCRQIWWPS